MIAILFLILNITYAFNILYSSIPCFSNATYLQCNATGLRFSMEAIGSPIQYYNLSYDRVSSNFSYFLRISSDVNQKIYLNNPGSYQWGLSKDSILELIEKNNTVLRVRVNKTTSDFSSIFSISIQPLALAVSNLFNLYSVPLSIIFLLIIANLSGFPLVYKVAVVSLGSFILGLISQNILFYIISFVGLLALGLLKFGGR